MSGLEARVRKRAVSIASIRIVTQNLQLEGSITPMTITVFLTWTQHAAIMLSF